MWVGLGLQCAHADRNLDACYTFGLPLMEKEDLGTLSCYDINWRIKADDWWILRNMGIITVICACAVVISLYFSVNQNHKYTRNIVQMHYYLPQMKHWRLGFLLTIIVWFWKLWFWCFDFSSQHRSHAFICPFPWSLLQCGSVQYHTCLLSQAKYSSFFSSEWEFTMCQKRKKKGKKLWK